MRIAMVAPLVEPVPPPLYGGTERVVSLLTEELVRRGHDVTLFASGDSVTGARLHACVPRSLRLDADVRDYLPFMLLELGDVYRHAGDFDLIHNHIDWPAFPFGRLVATPTLSTVHGRLDLPETAAVYGRFPEHPLISISESQRRPLPAANWLATVYNGIDVSSYHFQPTPGNYLVFLGRISPEKRADRAIAVAREVGMRLVIAAKVDPVDREYYEHEIAPLIRDCPLVEYIGEVDEREKDTLLGGAYAYLFPIDWPEPFGLTMVEAMATGTPVIAREGGSVREVVVDGVTGAVCDSTAEMIDAVERAGAISRIACREHVERHFTARAMAAGYERAYRMLIARVESERAGGEGAYLPTPVAGATRSTGVASSN